MNLPTSDLVPRRHFFGNPSRSLCQISPDGEWLSWTAPVNGVSNIWVAPRHDMAAARPITEDQKRGIHGFSWRRDSVGLLYVQDQDGDENWHVWTACLDGSSARNLTPYAGARAGIARVSPLNPDTILLSINDRDPAYADLYEVDIATGERRLVFENPGFGVVIADDTYQVKLVEKSFADGSRSLLHLASDGGWTDWQYFGPDDARSSDVLEVGSDGESVFLLDSRGRDTAALVCANIQNNSLEVIAADSRADITGYLGDNASYAPLAYMINYDVRDTIALDERLAGDIANLDQFGRGAWTVASRSENDRWWTIGVRSDLQAGEVFLYDRDEGTLTLLYLTRPELALVQLRPMQTQVLQTEDGLPLMCYLTLPQQDISSRPPPLVLHVHGGPWARDSFGYDPVHQWLANRGYAVLSVNFRSSIGFGKRFIAAGDGEWGAKMDDDLEMAVDWAISSGYADPLKLAIMGASYGGYAVLSALTRRPRRYACGIDIVGPSNLETLLSAIPPYWEAEKAMLYRAVGNPETADGRTKLHEKSPLFRASSIERPLLIAQGANDPRVPQMEADQMVKAIRETGGHVKYVVYSDEGHGFMRQPNALSFFAITEAFLAQYLGGRYEQKSVEEEKTSSQKIM